MPRVSVYQPPPPPPAMPQIRGTVQTKPASRGETTNAQSHDFASLLMGEVKQVNQMQHNADDMVHSMLTGGDVNQAEVLTAVQKADLAFRMMMQIRNKLLDAYNEIQQIRV